MEPICRRVASLHGRPRCTNRERTCAKDSGAIATQHVVNARTVESHVGSIFTKLDLPPESATNRRVKAVLAFIASSPV